MSELEKVNRLIGDLKRSLQRDQDRIDTLNNLKINQAHNKLVGHLSQPESLNNVVTGINELENAYKTQGLTSPHVKITSNLINAIEKNNEDKSKAHDAKLKGKPKYTPTKPDKSPKTSPKTSRSRVQTAGRLRRTCR